MMRRKAESTKKEPTKGPQMDSNSRFNLSTSSRLNIEILSLYATDIFYDKVMLEAIAERFKIKRLAQRQLA